MKVENLRNYGVAFSDAEAYWPKELKKSMVKAGRTIIFSHLSLLQRIYFIILFLKTKHRAKKIDISSIRARGMSNENFIAHQIEYISMFLALSRVIEIEKTLQIVKIVMEATAKEALLLCLPDQADMKSFNDPFIAWRQYVKASAVAACSAGCFDMTVEDITKDFFQFNITWCVWLELARQVGIPEACIPNCFADDLVFPQYFETLDIKYNRTGTLAEGNRCCDFRFERIKK